MWSRGWVTAESEANYIIESNSCESQSGGGGRYTQFSICFFPLSENETHIRLECHGVVDVKSQALCETCQSSFIFFAARWSSWGSRALAWESSELMENNFCFYGKEFKEFERFSFIIQHDQLRENRLSALFVEIFEIFILFDKLLWKFPLFWTWIKRRQFKPYFSQVVKSSNRKERKNMEIHFFFSSLFTYIHWKLWMPPGSCLKTQRWVCLPGVKLEWEFNLNNFHSSTRNIFVPFTLGGKWK